MTYPEDLPGAPQEGAPRENAWLLRHRCRVKSQFGEDGIIEKIFEIIGSASRWVVEFGAGDGEYQSNSWNLIQNHGWSGVLIEADRSDFEKMRELRRGATRVFCLNRRVASSGSDALDVILSSTPLPRAFDFCSIDIDGNDLNVWRGFARYRPAVVMIEFNPSIPSDIAFVQPDDPALRWGSSLLSTVQLGAEKGYELVSVLGSNAFFVERGVFASFGIRDNSPSALWIHAKTPGRFFQLHDGAIVLSGWDEKDFLCRKKKIQREAVYALTPSGPKPLRFLRDNRVARIIKNMLKRSLLASPLRRLFAYAVRLRRRVRR